MSAYNHYTKYDGIARSLLQQLLNDMESHILVMCADHFGIEQSPERAEVVRKLYLYWQQDTDLNNMPLKLWDGLAVRWSIGGKYSLAERVCLLKHVARYHILHVDKPAPEAQPA